MSERSDLTCRELVELVTAYLEGALDGEERERFERHLGECAGCRAYLDQMRHTIEATGRLAEADLSDEAAAALLRAFRAWRAE
jgi:anti-sigma factor RsiW